MSDVPTRATREALRCSPLDAIFAPLAGFYPGSVETQRPWRTVNIVARRIAKRASECQRSCPGAGWDTAAVSRPSVPSPFGRQGEMVSGDLGGVDVGDIGDVDDVETEAYRYRPVENF